MARNSCVLLLRTTRSPSSKRDAARTTTPASSISVTCPILSMAKSHCPTRTPFHASVGLPTRGPRTRAGPAMALSMKTRSVSLAPALAAFVEARGVRPSHRSSSLTQTRSCSRRHRWSCARSGPVRRAQRRCHFWRPSLCDFRSVGLQFHWMVELCRSPVLRCLPSSYRRAHPIVTFDKPLFNFTHSQILHRDSSEFSRPRGFECCMMMMNYT